MLNQNDRLTHEHANGWFSSTGKPTAKYWTNANKQKLIDRLGEYEDTGLSPAEVLEMKKLCGDLAGVHAVATGDGEFYVNNYRLGDFNALLKCLVSLTDRRRT